MSLLHFVSQVKSNPLKVKIFTPEPQNIDSQQALSFALHKKLKLEKKKHFHNGKFYAETQYPDLFVMKQGTA